MNWEEKIKATTAYQDGSDFTFASLARDLDAKTVQERNSLSQALGQMVRDSVIARSDSEVCRGSFRYRSVSFRQKFLRIKLRAHTDEELGILTGWRAYK